MALTPSAVQPEPLIGIFADPALDHRRDRLHRALNVDLAGGVTHRFHLFGEFSSKAVSRQPYDADAMDRAFDLSQKARQHRIGLGLAAEERHLNAIGEI